MEKVILKGRSEGEATVFDPKKHVILTDGCYEKNDTDNVVRVSGRFYRRNSPLVSQLSESIYGANNFALTEDITIDFITGDNIYSVDALSTDSNYVFLDFVDGQWSLKNVPPGVNFSSKNKTLNIRLMRWSNRDAIVKRMFLNRYEHALRDGFLKERGGAIFIASETVDLHPSYGTNNIAAAASGNGRSRYYSSMAEFINGELLEFNGDYHYKSDIEFSHDPSGNPYKPIRNIRTGFIIDNRPNPVYNSEYLDSNVRALILQIVGNLSPKSAINSLLKSHWFSSASIDSDFAKSLHMTKFGIPVGDKDDAKIIDQFYDICENIYSDDQVNTAISNGVWFGNHHTEPIPSLFTNCSIGNQGGDYVYYRGKSDSIGSTYRQTGGIGYTYGLELETEKGVIPVEVAKLLKVDCVGDRSIGGLEYVTGVLSGDSGMDYLKGLTSQISKYAFVSDTCGIHVHVGSNRKDWCPVFDKKFAVMAIMLGCKIEEQLFSLLPSDRMQKQNSNGQYYCGSIMGYRNISFSKWKNLLFHYVFDRDPEGESEEFDGLDSLIDRRHHVGRWASGRYKWLNLINCVTDNSTRRNGGGFQTIEFRAFNGTLNFNDIKAFTLISLAFVAFIEKNRNDFEKALSGVNLLNMIYSTMDEDASAYMKKWYSGKKDQISKVKQPNVTQIIG